MTTSTLNLFLGGCIFTGYGVIGLFFWRFWWKTRDRLFAWFAAAFWLLAFERILLLRFGGSSPGSSPIYLTRLLASLLIIAAIVGKNRAPRRPRPSPGPSAPRREE